MLLLHLIIEIVALVHATRQQQHLRRLRHRGGDFVELQPVTEKDFAHLPGLQPSSCYHLFLSRALVRIRSIWFLPVLASLMC